MPTIDRFEREYEVGDDQLRITVEVSSEPLEANVSSRITKIIRTVTPPGEEPPPDPPPAGADITPPPTPPNLTATGGVNQISLTCGSVADAEGPSGTVRSGLKDYGWYVASSLTGTYTLLRRTAAPSTTHTGLAAGVTRFYKVTARDNSLNESPQSAAVSATTQAATGNQPPVWDTAEFQPVLVGPDPVTLRLRAIDPEGDKITYAASGLPAGWDLSDTQNQTQGALLTIPGGVTPGEYSVTVTASDDAVEVAEGIANLKITPSVGGDVPWTFGHPFKRGDIPESAYLNLNIPTYQVEVRNRWDDGSLKFAVISGVSGSGFVNLRATAMPPPTGTPVAEPTAAWLAENVSVTLTGDGAGTYTPSLARSNGAIPWAKATPHKMREKLGHVMSEFHYYTPTTDAHLAIFWHLRCYSTGAVEVETVIENGWLLVAGGDTKLYGVSVSVGGVETYAAPIGFKMWTNAGAKVDDYTFRYPAASLVDFFKVGGTIRWLTAPEEAYTVVSRAFVSSGTNVTVDKLIPADYKTTLQVDGHCNHARWSRVDWVGVNPGVTPQHAGKYIQESLFSPYYYDKDGAPLASRLDALSSDSSPFARVNYPVTMSAAGTNAEPLERAAIFYVKTGDARAYRSLIAMARGAGRYGFHYRDETTGQPPLFTTYPTYGYPSSANFKDLKFSAGTPRFVNGGIKTPIYAKTHGTQTAYMAYLCEGRQSFLDQIEFNGQSVQWQVRSGFCNYEGQRIPVAAVTAYAHRGAAWSVRMLMETALCLPDNEPRRQQYLDQLNAFYGYYYDNFYEKNALGYTQPATGYNQGTPTTGGQQFMQCFFMIAAAWAYQTVGHLLANPTRAHDISKWMLKRIAGMFGDSTGYCYRCAGYYTPTLALGQVENVEKTSTADFNAAVLPDFRAVFDATALYDTNKVWVDVQCEDSTAFVDSPVPGSSYTPNNLTTDSGSWLAISIAALSYAVDFGVEGAAEGRARVEGASNWKPMGASTSSGFRNLPDWGIDPRE
jgi:hypothetical protein